MVTNRATHHKCLMVVTSFIYFLNHLRNLSLFFKLPIYQKQFILTFIKWLNFPIIFDLTIFAFTLLSWSEVGRFKMHTWAKDESWKSIQKLRKRFKGNSSITALIPVWMLPINITDITGFGISSVNDKM